MTPDLEQRLVAVLERIERRLAQADASTLTVPEACEALKCGRTKLFELVKSGQLVAVRTGKRMAITVESVRELQGLPARRAR